MNKHKFIIKAIEDGWYVHKENNTYIFKRRHNQRQKYFLHSYLEKFIKKYS
jgi:imidazoleglycerol phosphate synthase glutamine amidotransferase subunit HisH